MAEMFPKAQVIGTDLSPVQPSNRQWIPPNCRFEVDDAEREWIFERVSVPPRPPGPCGSGGANSEVIQNSFLFIHMRTVSIADWPALLKQIYLYAAKLIEVLSKSLT